MMSWSIFRFSTLTVDICMMVAIYAADRPAIARAGL